MWLAEAIVNGHCREKVIERAVHALQKCRSEERSMHRIHARAHARGSVNSRGFVANHTRLDNNWLPLRWSFSLRVIFIASILFSVLCRHPHELENLALV